MNFVTNDELIEKQKSLYKESVHETHLSFSLKEIDLESLHSTSHPSLYDKEDQDSIEFLKKELLSSSLIMPICVSPSGVILDGNHRFWAASELGVTKLPCLIVKED